MNRPGARINAAEDPENYIRACVEIKLEEIEKQIIDNNGYLSVDKNYMIYYGKRVPYLCRSSEFYKPCVNQEPMMIEKIRKEINAEMIPETQACFDSLFNDLKRKGYSVQENETQIGVNFEGNNLILDIDKSISIKKGEETRVYSNFGTQIPSPIYLIITTSQRIVDYESTFCEFNSINWMLYFKDTGVKRFVTSDNTRVYEVTDKPSGKKINFAVRSCLLPAGI